MSAGDASLAEVLAAADGRVTAHEWSTIISDLAAIGYEIVKRDASPDSLDLAGVYTRVEPKVLALLARLAPKGTKVTPELTVLAREGITTIVVDELLLVGMSKQTATVLGGLMSQALRAKNA